MKVLVPIKRVIDPYVKIRLRLDGSGVESEHVKMVMNPFDEIALEEAVRCKEAGLVTEIIAVSIGAQSTQETLRHALALGSDKAIHVLTDNPLEPLHIAKCLAAIVSQQDPQLIMMGKQAIDNDCNQTGQMLGALLGWPQATFASQIKFINNNSTLEVTREVDAGLETLTVTLPAVITTDLRLNEPRYPTLPNIMKAKSKPLEVLPIEGLGIDLKPHIECIAVLPPSERQAGRMVKDVVELVHYLRDIDKVI